MALNPYTAKIAVSTGSKGKRHFEAGRVALLKNEWKSQGVQIVSSPKDADYIVVPDGSADRGKTGKYVQPIQYSAFVELLARAIRPTPRKSRIQTVSARKEVETDERTMQTKLDALEERLRYLSAKPTYLSSKPTYRRAKERLREPETTTTTTTFYTPTIDVSLVRTNVQKLVGVTNLQEFVYRLVSKTRVQPLLYTTQRDSVEKIRQLVLPVLTFWQELRVNLELVLPEDLPKRIDLNTVSLCTLPEGLPYDLTNCWTHFFALWSDDNVVILTQPLLVENMANRKEVAQYFWNVETCLYVLYGSLQCAQYNLQTAFTDWARTVRDEFNAGKRLEKPFLFVLQELVAAFCGSTDIQPDKTGLIRLLQAVQDLYRKWFGEVHEPQGSVCEQITEMVGTIMATIKHEIGVPPDKELVWSELAKALSEEDLDRDWTSKESLKVLQSIVFGERYRQAVLEL